MKLPRISLALTAWTIDIACKYSREFQKQGQIYNLFCSGLRARIQSCTSFITNIRAHRGPPQPYTRPRLVPPESPRGCSRGGTPNAPPGSGETLYNQKKHLHPPRRARRARERTTVPCDRRSARVPFLRSVSPGRSYPGIETRRPRANPRAQSTNRTRRRAVQPRGVLLQR